MNGIKFVLTGEDKKTLSQVKSLLIEEGNLFVGYSMDIYNVTRLIRARTPELAIIESKPNISEIKNLLDMIDNELLCACILILDSKNKQVISFLRSAKIINYVTKPLYREAFLQISDFCLINYNRVIEYEDKLRKLNESIESRRIVDKAKWILIEREKITEEQAYEIIKKKSRDNRMPMKSIAEAIIITRCI